MTNFLKQKKSAFTLIELLVVIAIIGILSTLAVVALQNARSKARDSKRVADVKQIQTALELYFNDNGSYPTSITSTIATGGIVYMTTYPTAPIPADGDCTEGNNNYTYSSDGSTYSIVFCLGGGVNQLSGGEKIASSNGITGVPVWACGDILIDSRDSQEYSTVQIGTQCWFAENLAYLPEVHGNNATFVNLGSSQTPAYGVYGYTGTDVVVAKETTNYKTYGVLYNWYAAVATSSTTGTEAVRGACPTGWHVPSLDQYNILYSYVNSQTQYKCNSTDGYIGKALASNSGWVSNTTVCTVGNNQQINNSTGFNGSPAGSRHSSTGVFDYMGYRMRFWSSSFYSTNAYSRALYYDHFIYSNNLDYPSSGFSVRCLKD